MKMNTITYTGGYKVSRNQRLSAVEMTVTAQIDDGETAKQEYQALRKLVRARLHQDYMESLKALDVDKGE